MNAEYDCSWDLHESEEGNLPENADAFDRKYQEWQNRDWMSWLGKNLMFPFTAAREEDENDACFQKGAAKGTGGRRGLSEGFKRIVVNAGLDLMTVQGKGLRKFSKHTFHSLRHSFNSALANAGVPDEVRMQLTGHASPAMNHHYTHLQEATLKNAMTLLPLFDAKPAPDKKGDERPS
jgi:Phage integrase family